MLVHLEKQAQIKALLFDKALTYILIKYFNYKNIFLAKNAVELLEYIGINDYTIKLEKNKQPFFRLFHSFGPIELKTLKVYIKTNLTNSFI